MKPPFPPISLLLFYSCILLILLQSTKTDAKSWQQLSRGFSGGRRRLNKDNIPNNYEYSHPNSQFEDEYYDQPDSSQDPRNRRRSARKFPEEEDDLVSIYTSSSTSKMMVAVSTGISSFILTHFLLLMIIGYSHWIPLLVSALICSTFVFLQGDFADFTRSLGVFAILLSKNFTIHKFLPKFLRQFNAAILLSSRKPFPPSTSNNPWRYIPLSEAEDLQFSMTNTLLAMIITGAIIGWNLAKPIPLFPSWIGAILGASFIGYGSTLTNARGDFLRFLGYTLVVGLSELTTIADDVQLRAKTSIILSQLFFFCRGIDQQFHIMNTIKRWISIGLVQVTTILYSMRGDSRDGSMDDDRRGSSSSSGSGSRRYRASRYEEDEGDGDYYEDDSSSSGNNSSNRRRGGGGDSRSSNSNGRGNPKDYSYYPEGSTGPYSR